MSDKEKKTAFSRKGFAKVAIFVVILVLFLFFNPWYTLQENEGAIITRLGEIRKVETTAGLHAAIPFVEQVNKYSLRVLRIDGDAQKIPTKENQFVEVNTTCRWHIIDVAKFYKSLGSYNAALSKVADIVDASCRDIVSINSFDSIVRTSNIINEINATEELNLGAESTGIDSAKLLQEQKKVYPTITKGRDQIAADILKRANMHLEPFGLQLVDVIFKWVKYADELQDSVFKRMITERNKIASTIRSTGEGKKAEILGKLENEKQSILSDGYAKAEAIKGKADAEAAAIYANAYSKDPEFYAFWKSLETYKKTLPNIEKVISTDSQFFKYMRQP